MGSPGVRGRWSNWAHTRTKDTENHIKRGCVPDMQFYQISTFCQINFRSSVCGVCVRSETFEKAFCYCRYPAWWFCYLHEIKQNKNPARKSTLNIHWKGWCLSWNSNTLATWCEGLTHWKRPWCWERLKAGGEGDDRGWDGWMMSPTPWTSVCVDSGSWWWTGRPGVLQSVGSQRAGHNSATEQQVTLGQ